MNLKPNPNATPMGHQQAWNEIIKNVWHLLQKSNTYEFVQDLDQWEELFESYTSKNAPLHWKFQISKLREYCTVKSTDTIYSGKNKNISYILQGKKIVPVKTIEIAILTIEKQAHEGHVGYLQLDFIKDGSGKIYSCPSTHPFLNIHKTFKPTIINVEKYWYKIHKNHGNYDIRWKIILPGKNIDLIKDESLGGAFAVGILTFTNNIRRSLKKIAISAKLNSDGKFEPVNIEDKINNKLFGIVDKVVLAEKQDPPGKNFPKAMFFYVDSPKKALVVIREKKKLKFLLLVAISVLAMCFFFINQQSIHMELEYKEEARLSFKWIKAEPLKTTLCSYDICRLHLHLSEELRVMVIEATKDENNVLSFKPIFPDINLRNPLPKGSYSLPIDNVLLLGEGREFENFYVFYQKEPFHKTYEDFCNSIKNLKEHQNLKIFRYPKTHLTRSEMEENQ